MTSLNAVLSGPGVSALMTGLIPNDLPSGKKPERLAGVRIATSFITGDIPAGTDADPYPGAAIQAAIDDMPSTGGSVFIPSGVWDVTSTIYIDDTVTIQGAGYSTVLKGDGTLIILANRSDATGGVPMQFDIHVRDLKIDAGATVADVASRGLVMHSVTRGSVYRVWVTASGNDGLDLDAVRDFVCHGCVVTSCYQDGLRVGPFSDRYSVVQCFASLNGVSGLGDDFLLKGDNGIIEGCVSFQPASMGIEIGADTDNISDVICRGNIIIDSGQADPSLRHGISIGGPTATNVLVEGNLIINPAFKGILVGSGSHHIIRNNFFRDIGDSCIDVGGAGPAVTQVSIIGNHLKDNNNGIVIRANCNFALIQGNYNENITAPGGGFIIAQGDDALVSGNYGRLNGATAIGVRGNRCKAFGNHIIQGGTGAQGFDIENDAVEVKDNFIEGYGTPIRFLNSPTNFVIRRNTGYVTENRGIAVIANGTLSIVVAHGLAAAPTIVSPGSKHAEVSAVIWTADATNITFTVPSNVTADRDVSWYAEK